MQIGDKVWCYDLYNREKCIHEYAFHGYLIAKLEKGYLISKEINQSVHYRDEGEFEVVDDGHPMKGSL